MNENTHVYCTNCIFGDGLIISLLKNDEIPAQCKLCNPYNPEDSMPYEERKYYAESMQM